MIQTTFILFLTVVTLTDATAQPSSPAPTTSRALFIDAQSPSTKITRRHEPKFSIPQSIAGNSETVAAVVATALMLVAGDQVGDINSFWRTTAQCSRNSTVAYDSLPFYVHPLVFTVFGMKEATAVISNVVVIPFIITLVALWPASKLRSMSKWRATKLVIHWSFSRCSHAAVVASITSILTLEPAPMAIGVVAILIICVFIAWLIWELYRLRILSSVGKSKVGEVKTGCTLLHCTSEWSHDSYNNAIIGDNYLYGANLIYVLCSVAIGIAEVLPHPLCTGRVITSMVTVVLKCCLSVATLVPLMRYVRAVALLPCVMLCIAATMYAFHPSDQLETVASSVLLAVNVVLVILGILGWVCVVLSV